MNRFYENTGTEKWFKDECPIDFHVLFCFDVFAGKTFRSKAVRSLKFVTTLAELFTFDFHFDLISLFHLV